ncbi:hypothetical protein J6590_016312 [Homalodisca vitripennis]|nr:hypothetical protein J6590_016312 [Homalodisca vitripennis]
MRPPVFLPRSGLCAVEHTAGSDNRRCVHNTRGYSFQFQIHVLAQLLPSDTEHSHSCASHLVSTSVGRVNSSNPGPGSAQRGLTQTRQPAPSAFSNLLTSNRLRSIKFLLPSLSPCTPFPYTPTSSSRFGIPMDHTVRGRAEESYRTRSKETLRYFTTFHFDILQYLLSTLPF